MMGTKYSLQCRILERSNPLLTALLVKSAPLPSGFSAVTASVEDVIVLKPDGCLWDVLSFP